MEPTQHPLGLAAVESVVRPRAWRGHLLVTLLWAGVLGVSTRVELGHAALTVAVAVHVMGLVIGLGAVLLVDWYGLVWMAGLRTLSDCLRLAQAAHPLIWLGLGLLLASGIGLAPDLGSTVVWIKQVLVLVLLNNGVACGPSPDGSGPCPPPQACVQCRVLSGRSSLRRWPCRK